MVHMLNLKNEATPVLTRFQEFMEYEDILFYLLSVLEKILKTKNSVDEKFLTNLVYLLEHITLPEKATDEEKSKLFCCSKLLFI